MYIHEMEEIGRRLRARGVVTSPDFEPGFDRYQHVARAQRIAALRGAYVERRALDEFNRSAAGRVRPKMTWDEYERAKAFIIRDKRNR